MTCSCLQLDLGILQIQDQISTILVTLTTMMQLLEISSYWLDRFYIYFQSINRLICPISRNSHQISCILKVFYNDIGVYFNVCTKIMYAYVCMQFI